MPTVPSYQPGQVHNAELPNFRYSANATADSFGAQQGENLSRMGGALNQVAQQTQAIAIDKQNKLDNNYVRDALSNAGLEANQHLATNVYNKKGFEAVNVAPDVQKKFKEIADKYSAGLQNDQQREMFQAHFQQDQNQHMASVYGFQAKSQEDLTSQTRLAENNTAANTGILYRNDPNQITKNELTISRNTKAQWAPYGEKVAQAQADEEVSHYHANIATASAQDSAVGGLQYLNKWGSKIEPKQFQLLKDRFEHQALGEVADKKAQLIAGQPGMDMVKAQELVDGDETIKDVQQKTMILSNVNARLSVKSAAATAEEKQFQENSWKALSPDSPIDPRLPMEMQFKMQAKQAQWAKDKANGVQRDEYGKILDVLASDVPAFAKMNLYAVKPGFDISQTNWNFLKAQQDAINKGGDDKSKSYQKAFSAARSEASKMSLFKITTEDDDASIAKKQDGLRQYMSVYGQRLMSQSPEQQTDWKKQSEIRDDLLHEVVLKKSLFGIDALWADEDTGVHNFQIQSGAEKDPSAPTTVEQQIPDRTKAAMLIRDDVNAGKLTPKQGREKINAIGFQ